MIRHVFPAAAIFWLLVPLFALPIGCATYHPAPSMRAHVVSFDSDAMPHDAITGRQLSVRPNGGFDQYLDNILSSMDAWHAQQPAGPRKILVFVHGGMTPLETATQDAQNEAALVEQGGYYPIYIDWDSGFLSSYAESIVSVSQGRKEYQAPFARALLSPFYLFADVGRAVTRIPVVWSEQIGDDAATVDADLAAIHNDHPGENWVQYAPDAASVAEFQRLDALYAADPGAGIRAAPGQSRKQIRVSIGDTQVTQRELTGLAAAYAITAPAKFGLSWIIDGFGKSSWDNMTRRTLLLIDGSPRNPRGPRRIRRRSAIDPGSAEPVGAARLVIDRLFDHIRLKESGPAAPAYEITLVGHSMGSMVINELLAKEVATSEIQFKNIVYLAAACSVRDAARCVVPYLRAHPNTQFYNLTLHPTADLRERYETVGELPPRGSLLVWIDEFLSAPPTTLDRTMGRWDNVLDGIREFPQDIRGQMTIKAFALRRTDDFFLGQPQKHGQFRQQHYWEESFWQAGPPMDPASDLYQAVRKKASVINATNTDNGS